MALGRQGERQTDLVVGWAELPRSPGHAFYDRLQAVLVVAGFVGVVVATSGSSSDRLVVYTARSHYGEEEPFKQFADRTDTKLTLFGGEASELYERISSEGTLIALAAST